jgi:uncharacterized protein YdhG (YjbR/CyaY superfamily)
MATKPKSIDDYLAELSADKRAALQELRQTIKAAAPKAEECISYQLPAFRLNGMLVGFGATTNHCAFYLMSSTTVEAFKKELKDFDTSKGTIRFQADEPLPAALVRKLVKARLAENASLRETAAKPVAAPKKRVHVSAASSAQTNPDVIVFVSDLHHPLKREIKMVREIILGVSPEIREAIKWNAPSFRTTDFFATFNLRAKDQVQLIFHTGAKKKESSIKGLKITDPAGLIKWLAKDRCLISLGAGTNIQSNRSAFETIVREWIEQI